MRKLQLQTPGKQDKAPPPTANCFLIISLCAATLLFLTLIPVFLLLSLQGKPILITQDQHTRADLLHTNKQSSFHYITKAEFVSAGNKEIAK